MWSIFIAIGISPSIHDDKCEKPEIISLESSIKGNKLRTDIQKKTNGSKDKRMVTMLVDKVKGQEKHCTYLDEVSILLSK